MAIEEIDPTRAIAAVGRTIEVVQGTTIPDECLQLDVIVAIPGPREAILRLIGIPAAPDGGFLFSNLVVRGRQTYTRAELEVIRPLGFIIPDRPWRAFSGFRENGIYQAWPNGRVFRVRFRHLVSIDGTRINPAERDKTRLSTLIPVFIPRWVPPLPAAAGTTAPQADDDEA